MFKQYLLCIVLYVNKPVKQMTHIYHMITLVCITVVSCFDIFFCTNTKYAQNLLKLSKKQSINFILHRRY